MEGDCLYEFFPLIFTSNFFETIFIESLNSTSLIFQISSLVVGESFPSYVSRLYFLCFVLVVKSKGADKT
jgi:hypothetical protein